MYPNRITAQEAAAQRAAEDWRQSPVYALSIHEVQWTLDSDNYMNFTLLSSKLYN